MLVLVKFEETDLSELISKMGSWLLNVAHASRVDLEISFIILLMSFW
jgi:hypothetical protein